MKLITRLSLLIAVSFFTFNLSTAQENSISKEYKQQVIQQLSKLMNDFYVFPEVAKKTEAHLLKQFKEGHFDQFQNDESFYIVDSFL